MSEPDRLYAHKHETLLPFAFDEPVASVFSDMAERSIPGYRQLLSLLATIVPHLLDPKSEHRCYDLGCSLGATSYAIANALKTTGFSSVTLEAIDSSPAMINKFEQSLHENSDYQSWITPVCADITDYQLQPCSLVILHYTLQFVEANQRQTLINRIYQALRPGGWLLIAEKIVPDTLDEIDYWYQQFKKSMGYTALEIAQKRQALENIMQPDTLNTHIQRLNTAGFAKTGCWHQVLNFVALAAQK